MFELRKIRKQCDFYFSDFSRIIKRGVDTFMLHRDVYMIVFMNENSELDFYFSDFCSIIKRRVDTFMLH